MTQLDARQPVPRVHKCVIGALAMLLLVLCGVSPARAHPLAPALLELTEIEGGQVEVLWKRSLMRRPGDRVEPSLPSHCVNTEPGTLSRGGNFELARWRIDCGERGLVDSRIEVRGLETAKISAVIRITLADSRQITRVLRSSDPSFIIPARAQPATVFRDYTRFGFEHILTGMDHLLFVFGLLLLARGLRPLVLTITAFTVGHSISLALAVFDLVRVPQSVCDVVVAATILVLAVELSHDEEDRQESLLRRFPWSMTLCFGFLHGLGFAGALRQLGLPQEEIPMALLSFNLGIELGQLTFVAAVFTLFWKPLSELAQRIRWGRLVPVYAMGSLAAYWCFERVAALLA